MDKTYTFIENIIKNIPDVPSDSILSQTVFEDKKLKVILFGFAPGQELSEHTASMPAILHMLKGEASLTLGDDEFNVVDGAWAHMPPHLPHSIVAKTSVVMLLLMLKD